MRYAEIGNFGFGADIAIREQVHVLGDAALSHSPHVLYTNLVEPILRWEFVRRGYASPTVRASFGATMRT